ncbi:thioredoxin domain-containing protein [Nocardia sp. R7R-8]|uniref:thioredoxin domain-containing protein n=1 Tax=Nocardia sp. R7R-8 TaxID=3459304 RepID=UPI00403D60E7
MPTITLTQDNFDSVVTSHPIVLVDWWAGWCGPCQYFAPVYEASAERHPQIVHGKVDTENEVALTAAAQVTQYPTVMAFRDGLLVYSAAGALASEALEDLVQQILWLDMDQFRRELVQQADTRQLVEAGGTATAHRAGLAPTAPRYGWPGL